MKIKIFTTGGTIDKVYFDRKSDYQVGVSTIEELLTAANVTCDFECESILQKDSLDLTDADRRLIFDAVKADAHDRIIITHGTDTMVQTAKMLQAIPEKVIVFTGSMAPARFKLSDAEFNIGCAVAAVQTLPSGVYIVMNGRIFDPNAAKKSVEHHRFEEV